MAWYPITNIVPQYYNPDTNEPYSGAVLKAYQIGTLTNIPLATDNTGATTANSIALNADGYPEVSGNIVIPHVNRDYKIALYPDQESADADSGADWIKDNILLASNFAQAPLDPPDATDGGTDDYTSNSGRALVDGEVYTFDFQSANETTSPELNDGSKGADPITTRDGSALWAGALSGVHRFQRASSSWLVLDPNPRISDSTQATSSNTADAVVQRDSNGRAQFADPSAAQDAATQTWVESNRLALPGSGSDPSLSFDTWRTPNSDRPTLVQVRLLAQTDGSSDADVRVDVDESGGTTRDYSPGQSKISSEAGSGAEITTASTFIVRAGASYQFANSGDPNSQNAIPDHREITL